MAIDTSIQNAAVDELTGARPSLLAGIFNPFGGNLLGDGEIITDTQSPTDIMDLVSKYAFGDVGDEK